MHDLYQLGAVLTVIVVGFLYNGKQIEGLRKEISERFASSDSRMDARFTAMDVRLDTLHRDLTGYAREQGRHDARLDAIERGRAS